MQTMRFGDSRSRSGCTTCKNRHLKCDEEKPACRRCLRGAWTCVWPCRAYSFVHVLKPQALDELPLGTWKKRAFAFFCARTAPDFASNDHTRIFWSESLLRIAKYNSSFLGAICAIGALHEALEFGNVSDFSLALEEYGKVIRSIRKLAHSAHGTVQDIFLASVLFAAFDSLRHCLDAAITHLRYGLRILSDHNLARCETISGIPRQHVLFVFKRYESQLLEFGDFSMYRPSLEGSMGNESTNPITTGKVEYLQALFDMMLCRLLSATQHSDSQSSFPSTLALAARTEQLFRIKKAIDEYHRWGAALDCIVTREKLDSSGRFMLDADFNALLILQIWRVILHIATTVDLSDGEIDFDRYQPNFRAVVELAKKFLSLATDDERPVQQVSLYSVSKRRHSLASCFPEKTTPRVSNRTGILGIHPGNTPMAKSSDQLVRAMEGTTSVLLNAKRAETPGAAHREAQRKATFSLSVGVVNPLYICVTRCRDRTIRSAALSLLSECNRREGIWDSRLAAFVASRAMAIEESGLGPSCAHLAVELSDFNRIRHVEPRVGQFTASPRFYFARYEQQDAVGGGEEKWVEEEICIFKPSL